MRNGGRAWVASFVFLAALVGSEPESADATESFGLSRLIDAETGVPIDEGRVALVGPKTPLRIREYFPDGRSDCLRRFEGPVAQIGVDGRFQFENAEPGPEDGLFVLLEDGAWFWFDHARDLLAGGATMPVAMPSRMTGTVRMGDQAITDQLVELRYIPPGQPTDFRVHGYAGLRGPFEVNFIMRSGEDGRFAHGPFPPGFYHVVPTTLFPTGDPGRTAGKHYDRRLMAIDGRSDSMVELGREQGARIEGRVFDSKGSPVAGALIDLNPTSDGIFAIDAEQSDPDGRFVFREVPAGAYALMASKLFEEPGFGTGGVIVSPEQADGGERVITDPVLLSKSQTPLERVVLRPDDIQPGGSGITVKVEYEDWVVEPRSVRVLITQWHDDNDPAVVDLSTVKAGESIQFELSDAVDRVTLRVDDPDICWAATTLSADELRSTGVATWTLRPPSRLRGRVTVKGQPPKGHVLFLGLHNLPSGPQNPGFADPWRINLDSRGGYDVGVLGGQHFFHPNGQAEGLVARVDSPDALVGTPVDVRPLTTTTRDFDLVDIREVSGEFVAIDDGESGEKIFGDEIFGYGGNGPCVIDPNGSFESLPVPAAGLVPIRVSRNGRFQFHVFAQSDIAPPTRLMFDPSNPRPKSVRRTSLSPETLTGAHVDGTEADTACVVRLWHPHDRRWLERYLSIRGEKRTPVIAIDGDREHVSQLADKVPGLDKRSVWWAGPSGERLPAEVRFGRLPTRVVFE